MTDLLTKEERQTVERVRSLAKDRVEKWKHGAGGWVNEAELLLDIIDNLSTRGVKKYSEKELRAGFNAGYNGSLTVGHGGEFVELGTEEGFSEWLECARFLGALEEKCQT